MLSFTVGLASLFVLFSGCSSAPVQPTPIDLSRVTASLSTTKSNDASIIWVSIDHLPARLSSDKVSVRFLDKAIPLFPQGENSLGGVIGVPYLHKPGKEKVYVDLDSRKILELDLEVVEAKYKSEKLRVDPKRVQPDKKYWPRIAEETEIVDKIYNSVTQKKYWSGPFSMPIRSAVTSPFGTKRLYNGEMNGFHRGLDLRAGVGAPIRSPAAGKVVLAKDLFFTGNTVMLDHGYGVITLYAHLNEMNVKVGDEIERGKVIGLAGATGRVSGPHLHWGAIIQNEKVNPSYLTKVMR